MSPAGIPMFYGAFDMKTALKETYTKSDTEKVATVGKFEVLDNLNFVDVSNLPIMPGMFKPGSRDERHSLRFLYEFANDISKSVEKDGREHIDYVPTQIISEHLRHIHKLPDGTMVDGIIYKSSKENTNDSCVIFIDDKGCCDVNESKAGAKLVLVEAFTIDPEDNRNYK